MFQENQPSKFICSINLYLDDSLSVPVPLYHPENKENGFFDTLLKGSKKTPRISRIDFSFSEEFTENRAGGYYNTSCSFKSKNTNNKRAINLDQLKEVHYIGLVYADGSEAIIGRNDREQNAKPTLSFSSNENFSEVTFSCNSIMPITQKYTINTKYTFNYPFIYF
ncbi:hypothetical protein [Empedobacter falsenii]|uniref:Uncharacterized protein n=1 Tax=Empedobacter falsenii TaxID=343874 RepID=A0A376FZF8_9FLAO|nr:hypothetical protein [Empedobacter falsenii]STD53071.1 Uncharacterised protein [Empedobacter falsenii]